MSIVVRSELFRTVGRDAGTFVRNKIVSHKLVGSECTVDDVVAVTCDDIELVPIRIAVAGECPGEVSGNWLAGFRTHEAQTTPKRKKQRKPK
jgi:hypothetical protein